MARARRTVAELAIGDRLITWRTYTNEPGRRYGSQADPITHIVDGDTARIITTSEGHSFRAELDLVVEIKV